jgi:hypothetical protein
LSGTAFEQRRREDRARWKRATALFPKAVKASAPAEDGPSYRELQAQAKELDIPGNQSADDLKTAIAEAEA